MDDQLTWEDLDEDEGLLSLFERGPKPESMDKQTLAAPFQVVLFQDQPIAVVGASGAYDAVQKVLTFPKHPDVVVLIDGQIFVVTEPETVDEAVEEAVRASKSKRKRTIKKGPG
jgi:hypothetical protein